jgi:ADP-ribosyl-[dinitrogen reductase] hydrolase
VHYHQGMVAGENTLNAVCARLVTRGITAEKGYSSSRFLADYVSFMTTPGSHNDTYAESFHRDFFSNWAAGVPPERCAGKEGHNTPTIGGFVMLPPVVFANAWRGEALMKRAVVEHLRLTHDSEMLAQRAEVYAGLLADLARGKPLREAAAAAGKAIGVDVAALAKDAAGNDAAVVGRRFSTACYITDRRARARAGSAAARVAQRCARALMCVCALTCVCVCARPPALPSRLAATTHNSFPSVLYLAMAHADSFEDAVLSNTNLGGENCHRGSALGAIMGAAVGESGIPARFIDGACPAAATAACAHARGTCACTALTRARACVRRPGGFQGDQE